MVRLRPAVVRSASLGLVAALAGVCALAAQPASANRKDAKPEVAKRAPAPRVLVVPTVVGQAFVFAKGELDEAGFAWRVVGRVHGYASSTVIRQWPEPGARVLDTGAPLVSVQLRTNSTYPQTGEPQDNSFQARTPLVRAPGPQ